MKRSFRVRSMRGQPYQLIMKYEDGSEIVIVEAAKFLMLASLCEDLNYLSATLPSV